MNIAILIPELGGGGAERVAKVLGDACAARGDRVFYFVGEFGVKPVQQVTGTVVQTHLTPLESYAVKGKWIWRWMLYRHARVMRRYKKQYHIDCSISFMEEFNYLNVLSRCGDRVIVRVCTILSARPELRSSWYDPRNVQRVYSRADAVIAMSRDGENELRDIYGVPAEKVVVIPNPGAAGGQTAFVEPSWAYGPHSIVAVGRLDAVKQPDRLIRAFRIVLQHVPDARLLFLGKGPLDTYLQGLCWRYGIDDHVTFVGYTRETAYYMSHARAFSMTSRCEGFPNAMVQAMACGAPVVAADAPGGMRDILGIYDDAGEPPAWQAACEDMSDAFQPYGMLTPQLEHVHHRPMDPCDASEAALARAMVFLLTHDEAQAWYAAQSRRRAQTYSMARVMGAWHALISGKREG